MKRSCFFENVSKYVVKQQNVTFLFLIFFSLCPPRTSASAEFQTAGVAVSWAICRAWRPDGPGHRHSRGQHPAGAQGPRRHQHRPGRGDVHLSHLRRGGDRWATAAETMSRQLGFFLLSNFTNVPHTSGTQWQFVPPILSVFPLPHYIFFRIDMALVLSLLWIRRQNKTFLSTQTKMFFFAA